MKKEDAQSEPGKVWEPRDATQLRPARNAKKRGKQTRKNAAIALFSFAGELNALATDFLREDRKITPELVQVAKDKLIDALIFLRHADTFTEGE